MHMIYDIMISDGARVQIELSPIDKPNLCKVGIFIQKHTYDSRSSAILNIFLVVRR
jgi:hypothetical protein